MTPMEQDRDITRVYSRDENIAKLERLLAAMKAGEPLRIQVANHRFTVPADAQFSIEHELEGDAHELEFQFRWSDA